MKQNMYDLDWFFEDYQAIRLSDTCENELIEQPALRRCLPKLEGLRVLDLGCGGGQFARYCVEQGATSVTGVDISQRMLAYAKESNGHERITYVNSAVEEVELPDGNFDLVVSSLMMDYVRDYEKLTRKIASWLREGGHFVYSTLHPHITARKQTEGWIRDDAGNKRYWPLDNYCEEGPRLTRLVPRKGGLDKEDVVIYHRSMSTCINALISSGLMLEEIVEPLASQSGLAKVPHLISEVRRPTFVIFKSQKT